MIIPEIINPVKNTFKPLDKKPASSIPPQDSLNAAVKGVLTDVYLKKYPHSSGSIKDYFSVNSPAGSLSNSENVLENSAFDEKKAFLPLITGAAVLAGGSFLLSACLKRASGNLLKTERCTQLPDLAVNMNIREEHEFALYRAVRNPDFLNIIAACGVFIMSGITIACKNFIDGMKEIWLKKQSADAEKNLQEKLISVECSVFSGKLKAADEILQNSALYFQNIINSKREAQAGFKRRRNIFEAFNPSFKASDKKENKKFKNLKYPAFSLGVISACLLLGRLSLNNLKKTINNTKIFADKFTENTIDAIEKISSGKDKKDLPKITELLQSICAKPAFIKQIGEKYGLSGAETEKIISAAQESKKTIFADAPAALGGIPKKIQYYCYLDEPRGHLYNWILNPDNKFTKYIFLAFTVSGAIGYLFNQLMSALKDAAVIKENAKTELDLKKRLAEVEIKNFKAKKECAAAPLIEKFDRQKDNKTKEELKQISEDILLEIKNSPPYVYN